MGDVPVSKYLAVSIIIVFMLYTLNILKEIPCQNDMVGSMKSHFIHLEPMHIFSNLLALYALSRVENEMKSKKFLLLVAFIIVFSSVLEIAVRRIIPSIPCSIGFSGVLFGVMTWEMLCKKKIDLYLLASIIVMIATPSMTQKATGVSSNVSLVGHAIGAFAGALGGLVYRAI